MAIKSSGTLSFSSDLAVEFGDSAPYQLSDYYRGSGLVPDIATNINVPSSGSIAFSAFYNAVKLIPAVIPAGAIIFYDTTLAAPTPPAGWNLYNTGDNRFVEATSTQTAIGPGTSASVSSQTSSNTFSGNGGGHGNIGSTFTDVDSMSIVNGNTYWSPKTDGTHIHSVASTNISGRGIPYPPLKRLVPMIAASDQESLPQNAIIFRSTIPGTANWSQITASQNSAIMMGKSSSFNSGNDAANGINVSWTETSGDGGSHNHVASNTRGTTSGGFTSTARSQQTSGAHTHTIIRSLSVRVRQKILKAWKTAIANVATDDFILLFAGDFSELPSGWNCCNGRDGTESLDGWIIGIGAAATAQGSTVAATELTLNSPLSQISPTHGHGPGTLTTRFLYVKASSYHTSAGWNHFHDTTSQVFTSGYQPPTVRLGFIQYKNQLRQPYTPGDYVEKEGGFYVGDIRHPDGVIYDLFIANSFDLILPGQPRIGRQWQTEDTQRPLPTGMSILQTGYDGAVNTNYYANAGGYPAAEFCANLVHEGKDDWYLPSIFELQVIFTHLKPTIEENVQGVVTSPPYWMSSIGLTRLNYNPYRVGGNGTFVGTATLPAQTTVDFFKGENTSAGIAAQQPQNMATIGLKGSVWSSTPAAANSSVDVANAAYAFVFSWTNVGGGGVNAGRADGGSSKSIAYTLLPMRKIARSLPSPGQATYTSPGTYSWKAPSGVTSVSVVAVGGGGSGSIENPFNYADGRAPTDGTGGGGGGLGWKNNITVVPGVTYTVVVGAGGTGVITSDSILLGPRLSGNSGGDSYFISSSVVCGRGGGGGDQTGFGIGGIGGGYVGDGGGNGGDGGIDTTGINEAKGGGGGGAGGYSGSGGRGGNGQGDPTPGLQPTAGSGGGGGGGAAEYGSFNGNGNSGGAGGGGGGVGFNGQGANGTAPTNVFYNSNAAGGGGGSGGTSGGTANTGFAYANTSGAGGTYGGGSGGASGIGQSGSPRITTSSGASGFVRIIWPGSTRQYPSPQ